MDVEATLEAVLAAEQALMALLNMVSASSTVSNIIAGHVSAGTKTWTEAERQTVRDELQTAKDEADQAITNAGG